MSHEQRVCQVPAIYGIRSSPASYYGTAAAGGAAGGPAGSSSMLFFCVMYPLQLISTSHHIFGRSNSSNGGWLIIISSVGTFLVRAYNSTPAVVSVGTSSMLTLEGQGAMYLMMASYQNGTIEGWINGVSMGAAVTLGAGFTPYAGPTTFGVRSSTVADTCLNTAGSDCGMLDGYDVGTYVDPVFGNGGVGLSKRWLADLREGRYLTWPRAAVANSDWYWAAKDAMSGLSAFPTWVDRYSATSMLRIGSPQTASFPARPL